VDNRALKAAGKPETREYKAVYVQDDAESVCSAMSWWKIARREMSRERACQRARIVEGERERTNSAHQRRSAKYVQRQSPFGKSSAFILA